LLKYRKFLKNKNKNLNVKINSELYQKFAEEIYKDEKYGSITSFIEEKIFEYLRKRRKL